MKYSAPHQQALKAIKQGSDRRALDFFEKALQHAPENITLLIDYAVYLNCLYRYDESLVMLQRAQIIAPLSPAVIHTTASVAARCRAPELALSWLTGIPQDAACLFQAACLLERMGELDQAEKQLAEAEQLGGETVESRLLNAQLLMRRTQPGKSLDVILNLLDKAPNQARIISTLHYAKGKALDIFGDYSGAYNAWCEAKNQLRPLSGDTMASSRASLAAYSNCIEKLTPNIFEQWKQWQTPAEGASPIMVTGYPRSGTTLLEHCLRSDTSVPSDDENGAFGDLVWRKSGMTKYNAETLWKKLNHSELEVADSSDRLGNYQNALVELSGSDHDAQWILDKNPQLLMNLPVMLRLMPRMPVVVIHRDPRDVMLSCFSQSFGLNSHSVHYLSLETLAQHLAHIRKSAKMLKSVLGDQMLVASYEELVINPKIHRAETVAGLSGIAPGVGCGNIPDAELGMSYSPTYAEVKQPIYKKAIGRWKNYSQWITPHLELLEEWIEN